jgi:hypothetical protein
MVKATALGVVRHYKPSAYQTIDISDSWAKSLLQRMNFVKRKGTTQSTPLYLVL